jgi:hypothetical protein
VFILKQNIYSNHPGTANQSFSFFTLKILTPGVEENLNDDELVVCSAFLCRAMDIGACVPRSECFLFAFFTLCLFCVLTFCTSPFVVGISHFAPLSLTIFLRCFAGRFLVYILRSVLALVCAVLNAFLFAFLLYFYAMCLLSVCVSVYCRVFPLLSPLTHHMLCCFGGRFFCVHFVFGIGVCVCRSE